jgi:formate hydrogenlyase subunit 3/multisubunit Na+/H+ antiporter MnhD subunit
MSGLLVAFALGCFLLGGVIDLTCGVSRDTVRALPYALGLLGSASLFALGVHATTSAGRSIDLERLFDVGHGALRVDPLAGLFLTLLFAIAMAISACFITWSRREAPAHHRGTASGYLLLLGSVAAIVCASDAFLFLFAWELLTLSLYVLSSVTRATPRQLGAAWSTIGVGKVSGAALLFAFLLLAGHTGSFTIANWHGVVPGATLDVAWVLVVVGFGAKLGLVPFNVWIPVGYRDAPGPARAAMAAVASSVAVYGFWRFLGVLGRPPVWLVVVVLLAGGFTALLGITFAGIESSLTRVVAFSSVENAGLIVTAFGVALTGDVIHSSQLVAVGLLAATLQTVAHAVAKSALFVSLANIEAREGSDDLDRLRGVGRRMRWSGFTFGAGALTLAGLPPTIGFVSEWFILEALMQQFRVPGLALRLGLAAAAALVALTAGLGALVFLRVLSLTLLGRSAVPSERRREVGVFDKVGMMVLALGCLAIAALSPLEVRYIAYGLGPVVPRAVTLHALKSPWVLQPVFAGFSILSPSWLWVILPSAIAAVFLVTMLLSRGRFLRIRRVPSWHSASSGVSGPWNYTAFGFANPLRHVLANVLGTKRTIEVDVHDDNTVRADGPTYVEARTSVVEPIETYLYRPTRSGALVIARLAKRLQSGRLSAYVAYMLIALLAALAIVAKIR